MAWNWGTWGALDELWQLSSRDPAGGVCPGTPDAGWGGAQQPREHRCGELPADTAFPCASAQSPGGSGRKSEVNLSRKNGPGPLSSLGHAISRVAERLWRAFLCWEAPGGSQEAAL